MGLSSPVRRAADRLLGWQLRGLHVLGAILGGALTGGLAGGIGDILIPPAVCSWLIAGAVFWSLLLSLRHHLRPLGRRWQVPQAWNRTMPPRRRYFLWGMLLGCGLATPIYYPAFMPFLAAQFSAGVLLGGLSGAVFGGTRQLLALAPGLGRCTLAETTALLPRLRDPFRRLNLAVVVIGGFMLILVARG